MLQACLNGGRARREVARVPVTPDDLARDAHAACAAGAEALHVHPRGETGAESLAPGDVAAALVAIRAAVPGVPVGIGTGAWIAPGGRARHADMRAWSELPDYVSINLNEEDAPDVMALMAARGIAIEAGIWSVADARRYVSLNDRPTPLRILVEMQDVAPDEALAEADAVMRILAENGNTAPILLHGEGRSAWACIAAAARLGCQTRIGLEDVLTLPDATPAPDNAALVASARAILARQGRPA